MALHSKMGQATTRTELFTLLIDFLVNTAGWTLHDQGTLDGRDFRVFHSTGESGNENIYLRYGPYSSTDSLEVRAYGYWNPATHSGVREAFTSGSSKIVIQEGGGTTSYWFYADLDRVFIITKVWSTYYGQYSGTIRRFWDDRIARLSAAVSAGSSVLVEVDDASIFTANRDYLIVDNAHIEKVTVLDVDTASTPNSVLIETMLNGYASGAMLGEDPQPVVLTANNAPGSLVSVSKHTGWSSNTGQPGTCGAAHGGLASHTDPESRYGTTLLFPWLVAMTGSDFFELRGELIGVYAHGGSGSQEQLISDDNGSYRLFNLSGSGWSAVQES